MKSRFIRHTGERRVILIFAGWGMDSAPFAHVCRPGYDTFVVWDYRDLSIDWSPLSDYEEIVLIAWSMGVYAASMSIHSLDRRITARIAVNGTLTPVDDRTGIPVAIFEGTKATLDERRLTKFFRRMCGDRSTYDLFAATLPQRPADELVEELEAIYPAPILSNPQVDKWDRAIIGRDDAIFPSFNQQRAWEGHAELYVVDRPHYIDLQEIADAFVIDKERAAQRFESGIRTYDDNATVQNAIIDSLIEDINRLRLEHEIAAPGSSTLEIGPGSGRLSRYLSNIGRNKSRLHLWDLCATPPTGTEGATFRTCDAEIAIRSTPTHRFDTIASASTIQWFNSPKRFFDECHRVLRDGGLLLLTTFVCGNLDEVTSVSGRHLHLPTADGWRRMISDGFDILSFETADYDMEFDEPVDVLRHLKLTGVNALDRTNGPSRSPNAGVTFCSRYPRRLDGRCHLVYRTLRIILRKKA